MTLMTMAYPPYRGLTIWFFIIVVSCIVLFLTVRKAVKVNE